MKLVDTSVGARVDMLNDPTAGITLAVTLEVVIPTLEHAAAQALADAAHTMCPYSRATSGNIPVTILVSDD